MTETSTTETTPRTGHTLTIAAGVAVVVCLVAAAVLLALKGWQTAEIVALLTAVGTIAGTAVTALSKLVELNAKQDAQTERIVKIDHQTNGVLTARIEDAVTRALNNPIGYTPTDREE